MMCTDLMPDIAGARSTPPISCKVSAEVDGRPARTADALTGLRMRAQNEAGWTYNFHALLVIGTSSERTYLNWSYGSDQFEPVTLHARFALHLDERVTCEPRMHFALNLGWESSSIHGN